MVARTEPNLAKRSAPTSKNSPATSVAKRVTRMDHHACLAVSRRKTRRDSSHWSVRGIQHAIVPSVALLQRDAGLVGSGSLPCKKLCVGPEKSCSSTLGSTLISGDGCGGGGHVGGPLGAVPQEISNTALSSTDASFITFFLLTGGGLVRVHLLLAQPVRSSERSECLGALAHVLVPLTLHFFLAGFISGFADRVHPPPHSPNHHKRSGTEEGKPP